MPDPYRSPRRLYVLGAFCLVLALAGLLLVVAALVDAG